MDSATLGLFLALGAAAPARQVPVPQELTPEQEEFFEQRIRPVLVERCLECHGGGKKKPKGNLRLDHRAGWEAGGDLGPVIVPGDPEQSLLVRAIRYADPDLQMPPRSKLPDAEIALLVEWVARGAPDPRDAPDRSDGAAVGPDDVPVTLEHWAFQRMRDDPPPQVDDGGWGTNAVDRFVWQGLERAGLHPAPPADARTLVRRLYFDLVGLPPTPEEIETFVADRSSNAYERLVDRLLASPHYGERWGRYWLDLARYADSNGVDENLALAHAWRYRDWVVRAFASDLPYDRFLAMQIAGDLLPEPASREEYFDRWTATGFLVLGPKMLAEQDKEKLVMDVVDEQIDVAGKAILGLTLGCARCHDHKFDPVPTRDYYALAGIFKSTSSMAHLEHVSRWRERALATEDEQRLADEHAARVREREHAIAGIVGEAEAGLAPVWRRQLSAYLLAGEEAARQVLFVEAEDSSRSNLRVDAEKWGSVHCTVVLTENEGEQFAEWDLFLPHGGAWQLEARYASDEARPMRVSIDGALVAEDVLALDTGSFSPDGQTWQVAGVFPFRPGRNVLRLDRAAGSIPHLDKLVLVPLAADQSASDWPRDVAARLGLVPEIVRNAADALVRGARSSEPVLRLWRAFAELPAERFAAAAEARFEDLRAERARGALALAPPLSALLDGLAPASLQEWAARYQVIASWIEEEWSALRSSAPPDAQPVALADPEKEAVRAFLHGPSGPFQVPKVLAERLYPAELSQRIAAQQSDLETLRASAPPAFAQVLAVIDGEAPADVPVHVRGSHLALASEPTPRGALSACASLVPPPAIAGGSSGRLELARWLVDPEHPLTARVMVNRIWLGHFGEGIVRSPSNFGVRGEQPSHPELLDWLARELVRGEWSIKALHRLIVSSSAYRMSTSFDPTCAAVDPENRLLWRMNRRRLEAECLRDAMLAAAGNLDRTVGGTLLATENGGYVTNDQSSNQAGYAAVRRSLYLPIIRNAIYDFFATFDYADPSVPIDQRSRTTVASQALYLMNSPLALGASRDLAGRVLAESAGDRERLERAWLLCFARPPSASEQERGLAYVQSERARSGLLDAAQPQAGAATLPVDPDAERRVWQNLAQVLFASNEFAFVD